MFEEILGSAYDVNGECWEWNRGKIPDGYGVLKVVGRNWLAHRLAYLLAHGELDDDSYVCHRCDNPSCIRPEHLFVGTQTENMQDMSKKGRGGRVRGETHFRARLNVETVRQIRHQHHNLGYSQERIARLFDVSQSTISAVIQRKTWDWVV